MSLRVSSRNEKRRVCNFGNLRNVRMVGWGRSYAGEMLGEIRDDVGVCRGLAGDDDKVGCYGL